MATAPVPTQAKLAMAALSGLILLKIGLLKTFRHSGVATIAAFRDYLVTPPVIAVAMAIFAWAC